MNAKTVWAGVTVLALATALTACGSSSGSGNGGSGGASGSSTINILDITGTSGPTAIYGEEETKGMQAAAAFYNAQGGILGKKIVITVKNDNSDAATATSIATQELSRNASAYTMVWAGQEGTVSAALVPILKRYKVFATAVNDGNNACQDASACPDFFTQAGSASAAEETDAAALKAAGYTHIGIIADQATYDQTELAALKPDLDKVGITYDTVTFPDSAVSLTPEMSRLKSDDVQAVFALALGPSAGYVLKARTALGWSIPLTFDVTGSSTDLTSLVSASELQGVNETIQYCENVKHDIPAFADLLKYTPSPLAGNIICPIAGDGWGGIMLLAQAAKKANSLDPAALTAAAQTLTISSNEVSNTTKCWSSSNHEDVCQGASYFEVVPAGKLQNTRLYPLGS
jgi:branched-chain amino acid transport system substrate-binding protein